MFVSMLFLAQTYLLLIFHTLSRRFFMSNRYVWTRTNAQISFGPDSQSQTDSIYVSFNTTSAITLQWVSGISNLEYSFSSNDQLETTDVSMETVDGSINLAPDQSYEMAPGNTYYQFVSGSRKSDVFACASVNAGTTLTRNLGNVSFSPNDVEIMTAKRRNLGTNPTTVSNSASSTYPPRDYVSKSARIWP